MSGNGWYIDDTICDKSELLILRDGNRRSIQSERWKANRENLRHRRESKSCFFTKFFLLEACL